MRKYLSLLACFALQPTAPAALILKETTGCSDFALTLGGHTGCAYNKWYAPAYYIHYYASVMDNEDIHNHLNNLSNFSISNLVQINAAPQKLLDWCKNPKLPRLRPELGATFHYRFWQTRYVTATCYLGIASQLAYSYGIAKKTRLITQGGFTLNFHYRQWKIQLQYNESFHLVEWKDFKPKQTQNYLQWSFILTRNL